MKEENQKARYAPPRADLCHLPLTPSLLTSLSMQSDSVWDYGTEASDLEDYGAEPSGIGG